jgi:membrane protease YdiL (CAAX protease family)
MLLLMVAGAAAASVATESLGGAATDDLRARAVASTANYGTQLLLAVGTWWALSGAGRSHGALATDAAAPLGAAKAIALGALAMAVGWPLVQASGAAASTIQQSLSGVATPDTAHRTLEALGQSGDGAWIAATALVAVVLAPIVEEILYRGALQQSLHGLGMPRMLSIATAASLFAVAHWGSLVAGSEAGALTMLLALGLIFGWAYERTGSMWAPVAAHATFNAANLAIFLTRP